MPRKTSRSIRDDLPTQAALMAAGTDFDAKRWSDPRYPNIRSGIVELGLQDGQRVTRADVFDLIAAKPRLAVMLTIVWGYPSGKINRHRKPIDALFSNAGVVADRLAELQRAEPLPAGALIRELNNRCGIGISTSTTSKLAYFFGLTTLEGACVIYDHRVINTIMEGTHLEFRGLRRTLPVERLRNSRDLAIRLENARNQQTRSFAAYIATVNRLARRLSKLGPDVVTPDQVELALFDNAPPSSELGARTRSSKQISDRTTRRKALRPTNIDAANPQAA